jgi:hypothetical protein
MGHANQALWDRIKNKVQRGSKGGLAGQWSARKAQLLVKEYKDQGGKFTGPKNPNNSLHQWTKQDWRTRSGKPSLQTGERYLPAKAIKHLSSAEYARTTRKKRQGMRTGKQFVRQPTSIRNKTRKFRVTKYK